MKQPLRIRFNIRQSSLGVVLLATTDNGLCALYLDDDKALLPTELSRRFPHAELSQDDIEEENQILDLIDNPMGTYRGKLDIRGTPFQKKVWAALQEIPAGRTRTYAELAVRIKNPSAVRAVGTACGANHISVIIPCHRAIRADGSLAGFRWGLERKRILLTREGYRAA